jgi:hypothetical protein
MDDLRIDFAGSRNISFSYFAMKYFKIKKLNVSWAPVAHSCNPSYTGGRDQEDGGSRPFMGK